MQISSRFTIASYILTLEGEKENRPAPIASAIGRYSTGKSGVSTGPIISPAAYFDAEGSKTGAYTIAGEVF